MKGIWKNVMLVYCVLMLSCDGGWLDVKPRSSLVVPVKLADYEQLLNNAPLFEFSPELGEISADDYTWSETDWRAYYIPWVRQAHIWSADLYEGAGNVYDWNYPYAQILTANVSIEALGAMAVESPDRKERDRLLGSFHFLRALAFFQLAQLYAPAYDTDGAGGEPGLPLRLDPDVNAVVQRSSVEATYQQILDDLRLATRLIGNPVDRDRLNVPNRPAVLGLLARVHLNMGNYETAANYADSCLGLHPHLLDYNGITRIASDNAEILYCSLINPALLLATYASNLAVSEELYRLYGEGDLRKTLFFRQNAAGKPYKALGYYRGAFHFSGIATDEVLLIRSECHARLGKTGAALADINRLLAHRIHADQFEPLQAGPGYDLLGRILEERRKELVFRGLRWSDLKRYNRDGADISLRRGFGEGNGHMLRFDSPKWVMPIPPDEVALSGIVQNKR